jgi:hypothetical protein
VVLDELFGDRGESHGGSCLSCISKRDSDEVGDGVVGTVDPYVEIYGGFLSLLEVLTTDLQKRFRSLVYVLLE